MPPARRTRRPSVRSLADDLRGRGDDALADLLITRPDLARPAPADLTSLAARASTRASIQRALDGLDRGRLQALQALAVSGASLADEARAAELLGVSVRTLRPHVEELWRLALCWRGDDGLHVVRPVLDALGPYVAGLAPARSDDTAAPATAAELDALLADAPDGARQILDRLTWGPPLGDFGSSASPAQAGAWLRGHGLLDDAGEGQVLLPREVALLLRGGRLGAETALTPPELDLRAMSPESIAAAAAGQASTVLEHIDELAALWGPRPPRVLRAGGLSVRDLRALAVHLDRSEAEAAFVAEIAYAAGLIGDDGDLEPVWAPTPAYDEWQQQPAARRWLLLARTWLASTRSAHRAGGRHTVPGRSEPTPVNALSDDIAWPIVRSIRHDVLAELAALPDTGAPTPRGLVERLRWRRPLRPEALMTEAVTAVVTEAEWLGATGRGALSPAVRAVLAGAGDAEVEDVVQAHLPAPVDHVLLQADLTAIAPGRVEGSLAQFLRLAADVESRGGATVYRFSTASLRRCLDTGWSADQILDALRDASQTPVPQPLEYLVRDVGRRHGHTRVGAASSYVRADDTATLDTIAAHKDLTPLQLRRLAPTVLVSDAPPFTVVDLLRAAGFAPVVEAADGAVVVQSRAQHRAQVRGRGPSPRVQTVDDAAARGLVDVLRAGEATREVDARERDGRDGPAVPSSDPAVTLALVRDAIADRGAVWIGVADAVGSSQRLLLRPERIEGGRIHGTVDGHGAPRAFSVHRITGAVPAT